MSQHGTIRRYTLIFEKIIKGNYPSLQILKEYLFDHGFEMSVRTLQRDIEQIRFEFDIEIQYDRARNGYFIHQDSEGQTERFLRFLEIVNTAGLLTESLKESRNALRFISFEAHGSLKGIEYLKPLLSAVIQRKKVAFAHENFESGLISSYIVLPYFLKEFQNRWYLIAETENGNEIKSFGVDRLSNVSVTDQAFEAHRKEEIKTRYNDVVGLNLSDGRVEKIVLSMTPLQGKYIKALPLHHSQTIVEDSKTKVVVRLSIIPNFEFKQRILMMGEFVTVLEPKWLAEEIAESLKNTLKKYD